MKNLLLIFSCVLIFSCQNSAKKSSAESKDSTEIGTSKTATPSDDKSSSSLTNNSDETSTDSPSPATPGDTKLQGIDISHYQSNIDWNKLKNDQLSFVFIKATAGMTFVDPSYTRHWDSAKQAGIMRGAYHFYYTKDDPTKQANFFISKVLAVSDKTDLPPVIDIESGGVNTDISISQLQKDIQTFLEVVEKAFDRKPILYTSHAFAQKYFDNTSFDKYYLWLADYDGSPNVPDGWKNVGWTFWQNSPSATINGIENKVDHDFFNGNIEKLKNL